MHVFVVFGSGMCLLVGRMMGMDLCSFRRLVSGEESLVW